MTWWPAVAVAAATAAALALALPLRTSWGTRPRRGGWWLGAAAAATCVVLAGSTTTVALTAAALAVALGARALGRRRRDRAEAAVAAGRVLETCELMASELAAGHPPDAALQRAAAEWPVLGPAAKAADLGSDLPAALVELARTPGAEDLRLVAAAWSVAHRTGGGLAAALDRVAEAIRGRRATRRVVESELASARATARLVAVLPLVMLLVGSGEGSGAFGFLLGHPAGMACLAVGLGLGFAGLWWIERIADEVTR